MTVAGDPYVKSAENDVRPADVRLAMAKAAFDDLDLVAGLGLRDRAHGPSYTIDTVRELLKGADDVDLIVGADLATQLNEWQGGDELRTLVRVGIVPRPGCDDDRA